MGKAAAPEGLDGAIASRRRRRRRGCLVALLVAMATLALLAVAAGFWIAGHRELIEGAGRAAMEEGRAFGIGVEPSDCLTTAVDRLASESGFLAEIRQGLFLTGCLEASPSAPSICVDVPPAEEIMESVRWSLTACRVLGHPENPRCARLVRRVQEFCDRSGPQG